MQGPTEDGEVFPAALPEEDREIWRAMTPGQRARAGARLRAILAWRAGELPLDDAVVASGLSRTRFYAVAARFRTSGTLASLEALAGAGASRQKLDPGAVNALQAVVAEVVANNGGASTSRLVELMVAASGVTGKPLPGATRLRGIVEAELRRVEATGQAGHALKLDMTAVNLPRGDGRPHVMFAVIDEGTRLVLGAAVGPADDVEAGYRAAALDARARIAGPLSRLRWVDRLTRVEVTVRDDAVKPADGTDLRSRLIDGGVRAQVQAAPGRYGRYWRKLVGQRVGRVEITPTRTVRGLASPDNDDMTPWGEDAARAAIAHVVDRHDDAILEALDVSIGRPVPPDDMTRLLEILAA